VAVLPFQRHRRNLSKIRRLELGTRRLLRFAREHSLGKGEVVSSILTGSTRKTQQNQHLLNRALPFPPRFGPEQIANSPGKLGEIWGTLFC
jgi:hypothetical protein